MDNFSSLAMAFCPGVGAFVVSINLLKIYSLVPIKFPDNFLAFFNLFGKIQDKDTLFDLLKSDVPDEAEYQEKVFTPINPAFAVHRNFIETSITQVVTTIVFLVLFYL